MDSGGKLPGTGVIVVCLWSPAPYLILATQAPSTESTSWCGKWGQHGRWWPPQAPAAPSLACLCCFCACCWSPGGPGDATLVSLRELLQGRPLPGGSCLWVWSVQTPCFKGSGRELAIEASPQLIKNFFLFLNHHVFISHWNKVSF